MTKEIKINDSNHIHTEDAAKRLGVTRKRILEYIADKRLNGIHLNGYYIPEEELKAFKFRRPGRPSLSEQGTTTKKKKK